MKLVSKINYNFISLALFILFAGGVVFYIVLRKIVVDRIDSDLIKAKTEIIKFPNYFLQNKQNLVLGDEFISSYIVDYTANNTTYISDTLLFNSQLKKIVTYRQIVFNHEYNNETYKIRVYEGLSFTDNLTLQIMLTLSLVTLFFMLSFFFVFRFVLENSMFDFYNTINTVKGFKVDNVKKVSFSESDVEEFNKLNEVLEYMTSKIAEDYKSLKEYTQNVSHEIQTPLAVIQSRLEQVIQDDCVDEKRLRLFTDILESTSRLSKLNTGLSQLVKIESGQFSNSEKVNLNNVLDKNIYVLEDMLDVENINIEKQVHEELVVLINPNLAELLIVNLLKNAVKHNIGNGFIKIETFRKTLIVSNTGNNEAFDFDKLGKRFVKGASSKSLGLGLSIIKNICNKNDVNISYSFVDEMHFVKLTFK